MRCLPNIDIFSPSSDYEIEYITDLLTLNHKTPAYLRIDKTKILETNPKKIKNLAKPRLIIKNNKKESEIAIFSSGGIIQEVKKAVEKANNLNISCSVYSIFNISKLDKNFSKKFKNKKIIVVEETIKENGIYIFLKENLSNDNIISSISLKKNSIYFNAGSQTFIRKKQKVSENYILKKIIDISKLKV
jgi:deoxyxylulose-5-phosphate synthase